MSNFQLRQSKRLVWLAGLFSSALLCAPVIAQEKSEQGVLRVCQDPNNLPFSNEQKEGFENKIAALFAEKLGWKLEHTWYPQRMGFIRNTLKAKVPNSEEFKCDLVTSVATSFDMGLTTKPYYHSTYALAYVKGNGLDSVKTPEDLLKLDQAKRDSLRIGVFAGSPAVDWLLKNGLISQMVSYQSQTGDSDQYTGQIVDKDLAEGKIDVAIAWGPIVGYFAKTKSDTKPIEVVAFKSTGPDLKFDFNIAMATRYGDNDFRDRINKVIETSQPEINAILTEYGVPQMPITDDSKKKD
jgi:mxaJ protein